MCITGYRSCENNQRPPPWERRRPRLPASRATLNHVHDYSLSKVDEVIHLVTFDTGRRGRLRSQDRDL